MLRALILLALALAGCTRSAATDGAMGTLVPDEKAALVAIFSEGGVEPAHVAVEHDLFAVSWRGAEGYAYSSGHADRIEEIRRQKDDIRDVVAIEDRHVVALRLGHTRLKSLATVAKLTHLVVLDIHDSPIADPSGAATLPALTHLSLAGDALASTAGLSGVSSLRTLYLTDNQIEHLDGVANMAQLDVLNAAGNRIAKMEGLDRLPQLRVLSLASNPIARIEGLQASAYLLELNLSYCRIRTIENLEGARYLRDLQLWRNQISDLSPLLSMPSLVHVGIGENPVDWNSPGFHDVERKSGIALLSTGL